MSRANTNISQSSKNSFKELQLQIEEFRQKRDDRVYYSITRN